MSFSLRMHALLLSLIAVAPPLVAQSVIVVDSTGAGDFTDLQPAVNAAAAGDILLVRSVLVVGATIDGKGLTLIGDVGSAPDIGKLYVFNLPAGQAVTARHVQSHFPGNMFEAMQLLDDAGTVFLEDIDVAGDSSGAFHLAATGLRVTNCSAVVVNDSSFSGGGGSAGSPYWSAKPGGEGLAVVDSQISVTWSDFFGGAGAGDAFYYGVGSAADGILATGGYLFLSGSSATGGPNVDCSYCGDDFASDGLHVDGGLAQYTDSTFTAGTPPPTTTPGQDIDADPGMAQNLNEPTRILFVSSPLRFDENGVLLYSGQLGDRVSVFASTTTAFLPSASKAGVWQLGTPAFGPIEMGVADDTGLLKLKFHAPSLAPLEGATIFLQAAVKPSATGGLRFSGSTSLTLLDPAF